MAVQVQGTVVSSIGTRAPLVRAGAGLQPLPNKAATVFGVGRISSTCCSPMHANLQCVVGVCVCVFFVLAAIGV